MAASLPAKWIPVDKSASNSNWKTELVPNLAVCVSIQTLGQRESGHMLQVASENCEFLYSFDGDTGLIVTHATRILYNSASPCQTWISNLAAK